MKTGNVPHVNVPVSRIVMGCDWLMDASPRESFKALDAYWEAGGRTFDSAHCYGANTNILGAWLTARDYKDEAIYFDKGCHPYGSPRFSYEFTLEDLNANHKNLGVEHTHFFVFHRDDPSVPVGEVCDWMNEIIARGRIQAYGGSNWEHTRIAELNEYASKNGKQGMSLNNPNMTLASNSKPLWSGCLTIGDAGRKWHEETQMPLFAWSSTARGYFAGTTDSDVLAAYDNPESQARKARATEVGEKHGLTATQVALAWVLNQPFPVFALCGLRTVENVEQNLAVLDVTLSPSEMNYLEHGS